MHASACAVCSVREWQRRRFSPSRAIDERPEPRASMPLAKARRSVRPCWCRPRRRSMRLFEPADAANMRDALGAAAAERDPDRRPEHTRLPCEVGSVNAAPPVTVAAAAPHTPWRGSRTHRVFGDKSSQRSANISGQIFSPGSSRQVEARNHGTTLVGSREDALARSPGRWVHPAGVPSGFRRPLKAVRTWTRS